MYVLLNLRVKAVKEYSLSHTHISILVKKQTKKKKHGGYHGIGFKSRFGDNDI